MSGPNDSYDPKQVAVLAPEALAQAVEDAEKAFAQAADLEQLAAVKPTHLGDRSPLLAVIEGEADVMRWQPSAALERQVIGSLRIQPEHPSFRR